MSFVSLLSVPVDPLCSFRANTNGEYLLFRTVGRKILRGIFEIYPLCLSSPTGCITDIFVVFLFYRFTKTMGRLNKILFLSNVIGDLGIFIKDQRVKEKGIVKPGLWNKDVVFSQEKNCLQIQSWFEEK